MVKCKEAFASQNSIGLALLPRGNFTKSLSIATFLLGLVSTSILPLLPFPPTWHGNCSTKESSSQKSFFSRCYTKTKWLINKATWPDVGTKRSFLFRFLCDDGKSLEARDSLSEKFATTVLPFLEKGTSFESSYFQFANQVVKWVHVFTISNAHVFDINHYRV